MNKILTLIILSFFSLTSQAQVFQSIENEKQIELENSLKNPTDLINHLKGVSSILNQKIDSKTISESEFIELKVLHFGISKKLYSGYFNQKTKELEEQVNVLGLLIRKSLFLFTELDLNNSRKTKNLPLLKITSGSTDYRIMIINAQTNDPDLNNGQALSFVSQGGLFSQLVDIEPMFNKDKKITPLEKKIIINALKLNKIIFTNGQKTVAYPN